MRIVGIDPGTGSFDFFGMDGGDIIADMTIPVPKVAENPHILIDTINSNLPLDMIVGPSGYGMAVTPIKDITERDLTMMVPDDKSIPLYDGIRMVVRLMKQNGFPVYFTPGVIHLPTVPEYRKANKMDMGTADKVCCVALGIRDQAERHAINFDETSFIMVEIGFAFNAVMAIERGRIVDGLGGTAGGPGFITLGSMDSELAVRLGDFPGVVLFSGGVKDASGKDDLTPEELAQAPDEYAGAWQMMLESIIKGVAAMTVSVPRPREILLSGRLSRIPEIENALSRHLGRYGPVRKVARKAKIAKEAAEGAYIIGNGLSGGQYRELVQVMDLRGAQGTMYDHILVKGAEIQTP